MLNSLTGGSQCLGASHYQVESNRCRMNCAMLPLKSITPWTLLIAPLALSSTCQSAARRMRVLPTQTVTATMEPAHLSTSEAMLLNHRPHHWKIWSQKPFPCNRKTHRSCILWRRRRSTVTAPYFYRRSGNPFARVCSFFFSFAISTRLRRAIAVASAPAERIFSKMSCSFK